MRQTCDGLLDYLVVHGGAVYTHYTTNEDTEVTVETTKRVLDSYFEALDNCYRTPTKEESVERKEFIDGKLIEKAKEALYDECVFQSMPIIKDGFRLDLKEWASKAVWRTPSWISKDELIELLEDRLCDDYELLYDKFHNAKEPADDME